MLDFAEQTGSGIVIVVWSFLTIKELTNILYIKIFGKGRNDKSKKLRLLMLASPD
jgi:hypothetical protein